MSFTYGFLPPNAGGLGVVFLFIWGILVTADSPQFSTLVAQATPAEYRGTALTLVNCLGFGLTILSIQWTEWLIAVLGIQTAMGLLSIGPMLGIFLFKKFQKKKRPCLEASLGSFKPDYHYLTTFSNVAK